MFRKITAWIFCLGLPVYGQFHGVQIGYQCDQRCPGEVTKCTAMVQHADGFGDTVQITEIYDIIESTIRVPAKGNLSVALIEGNAYCSNIGGICNQKTGVNCSLPCYVGPPDSTSSGLPGETTAGTIRFAQNEHLLSSAPIVQGQVHAYIQDLCDNPKTSSCSNVPALIQFTAVTRVITCPEAVCSIVSCSDGDCSYEQSICEIGGECDGCPITSTSFASLKIADGVLLPVFFTHAPNDFNRVFVVQQTGDISVLEGQTISPFSTAAEWLLDCQIQPNGTCGLWSLAFHPQYPQIDNYFVYLAGGDGVARIVKYPGADIILSIPDTEGRGWIGFGPQDGYLYVSAGTANPSLQAGNKLSGNVLRLNVDGDDFPEDSDRDYAVPSNPAGATLAEIYALGLSSPVRAAFDLNGDLYVVDQSTSLREINVLPYGTTNYNFGAGCFEGNTCINENCCDLAYHSPIWTSDADCSIMGGEVYTGCNCPDLYGTYLFADLCTAQVWGILNGVPMDLTDALNNISGVITGFGKDAAGDVYIGTGLQIYKIIPRATFAACASGPESSKMTSGCEGEFSVVCSPLDQDSDADVDLLDFQAIQNSQH